LKNFGYYFKLNLKVFLKKPFKLLLQFSTSYLCDLGFSTLNNIKEMKRERLLNIEEEMRVDISHIRPDIATICKNHQAQVSIKIIQFK